MNTLAVFVTLVVVFAILLALKGVSKLRFCVMCLSVACVWIGLLLVYWFARAVDPVLLALLMGQSITGLSYFVENRIEERWLVFRLPFVLTLTLAFYSAISGGFALAGPADVIATIWLAAFALFAKRHSGVLASLARQVIACCRDW